MCRLSEKLLVILLTLLLGLSPLQGAIAGFASSFEQEGGVHQMADRHDGGIVMAADHAAAQDCEQCNAEAGCNGHSCSSGQCASCVLAVLPIFPDILHRTATSGLLRTDNGFVSKLSSSLFRPPRA